MIWPVKGSFTLLQFFSNCCDEKCIHSIHINTSEVKGWAKWHFCVFFHNIISLISSHFKCHGLGKRGYYNLFIHISCMVSNWEALNSVHMPLSYDLISEKAFTICFLFTILLWTLKFKFEKAAYKHIKWSKKGFKWR